MKFLNPAFLWLLVILPLLTAWKLYKDKKLFSPVTISSVESFKGLGSVKAVIRKYLFVFRIIALGCLIIALARPRSENEGIITSSTEGIDIVLSIDVSGSMLAEDLKPNRMEALKSVASQFIRDRISDRIGLVVYSGEAYTRIPVTADRPIVLKSLKEVKFGEFDEDASGTAIGLGLATSINRLKDSKAKSKVIILMTDGVNNTGSIDPYTAADLAKTYNIKVYTLGIGTNGMALTPVAINPDGSINMQMVEVKIDETLLKSIAQTTGGKYFRANSNKKLEEIYKEIDKLEKSKIEEFKYYNFQENFRIWVIIALVCVVLEFTLKHTYFRGIY